MLKLVNVNKTYNNISKEQRIGLNNINITLPDNGLVSIVGDSGNGKSTLLNIIATYDFIDSGKIIYNDTNLSNLKEKQLDYYRKNIIGFIYQDFNLIEDLTVYENISLIKLVDENTDIEAKIEKVMKDIGITGIRNSYPKELSGGEKQRVAIARLLVKGVNIILADEPTGNLDEANQKIVNELLKELSYTKLVIIVTHSSQAVNKYSDRIVKLKNGEIIDDSGTSRETDRKQSKFTIEKDKLSLKKLHTLSKQIVLKKKMVILPIILFSFISLFLFGTGLNLCLMKTDKILINEFEKNNESSFIINSDIPNNTYMVDTNSKYVSYSKKFDGQYNIHPTSNYTYKPLSSSDYYYKQFYDTTIKNITISDNNLANGFSPEDNGVTITDYFVGCLNFYTTANYKDPKDCIGDTLPLNGHFYVITNVISTDYKSYLGSLDKDFNYGFSGLQETNRKLYFKLNGEFSMLYMNQNTYNDMQIPVSNALLDINGTSDLVYKIDEAKEENIDLLVGDYPINKTEINVPYQYFNRDIENPDENDFSKYLNTEITLNIEGTDEKYTVSGITNDYSSIYILSDTELNNFLKTKYENEDLYTPINDFFFIMDGSKESKDLLSKLVDNSYYCTSLSYETAYGPIITVESTAKQTLIISLVLLIFFILLTYFLISSSIKQNQKIIGVLNSIGISKKEISKIYLYKYLILGIIVSFISCIVVFFSVPLLNYLLILGVENELKIIYLSWYTPILVFIVGLSTFYMSTLIPLKKLEKKSIINVIYNK